MMQIGNKFVHSSPWRPWRWQRGAELVPCSDSSVLFWILPQESKQFPSPAYPNQHPRCQVTPVPPLPAPVRVPTWHQPCLLSFSRDQEGLLPAVPHVLLLQADLSLCTPGLRGSLTPARPARVSPAVNSVKNADFGCRGTQRSRCFYNIPIRFFWLVSIPPSHSLFLLNYPPVRAEGLRSSAAPGADPGRDLAVSRCEGLSGFHGVSFSSLAG